MEKSGEDKWFYLNVLQVWPKKRTVVLVYETFRKFFISFEKYCRPPKLVENIFYLEIRTI